MSRNTKYAMRPVLYRNVTVWCFFTLFICSASKSYSQYFSNLYDNFQFSESGTFIYEQSDSNYLIVGEGINMLYNKQWLYASKISSITNQTTSAIKQGAPLVNYFLDFRGRGIKDNNGNFILPFTIQPPGSPPRFSSAGYCKITNDSIITRTYTDTTNWFERSFDCALGGANSYYIGGQQQQLIFTPKSSAILRKVDTSGNLLWTRLYVKDSSLGNIIESIEPLDSGRILIGASVMQLVRTDGFSYPTYYHRQPWFFITDSSGNILKDGMLDSDHMGGGKVFKDKNGGYFHWGALYAVFSKIYDWSDFPEYIAHLDDSFHVQWLTKLTQLGVARYIGISTVKQTRDSNYLLIGTVMGPFNRGNYEGAAIKVSKTGAVLWSHRYTVDSTKYSFLYDGIEKPNGNFVLVGAGYSSQLPLSHYYDTWLLSIDSNGCELPGGCAPFPTSIASIEKVESLSIYPNPIKGNFTIEVSASASAILYDMNGRIISNWELKSGKNELSMPTAFSAGMYFIRIGKEGAWQYKKVIYQP